MDDNVDYDSNNSNPWGGLWNIIGIIIGVIIVGLIIGRSSKYEGQTAEEWFNDYDYCTSQVQKANTNIEEANTNIDEVNSKIEDAKFCEYGGCDYEEMQSKISYLDKAEQVEPVEEP